MRFRIGERVKIAHPINARWENSRLGIGSTGVVGDVNYLAKCREIGVIWDNFTNGHSNITGGGRTDQWYVDENCLIGEIGMVQQLMEKYGEI